MKMACLYRATVDSPIIQSLYNPMTGLIDGVPSSMFSYVLPTEYTTDFIIPPDIGVFGSLASAYEALIYTESLFLVKFYDVGFTIMTHDRCMVYLLEGGVLRDEGYPLELSDNIFRYKKHLMGIYKTKVTQMDIPLNFCRVYVDDEGNFLSHDGVYNFGFACDHPISTVDSIGGLISLWRKGFDGVVVDAEGREVPFVINK